MTKKYKTRDRVPRGPESKMFTIGLREINAELALKVKDSLRNYYFDKRDCREAFDKTKGHCAFCGVALKAVGDAGKTARFMLYYPLETCGKIERSNLVAVCLRCKRNPVPKPRKQGTRIPNVDTFADLVDRLAVEIHKLAWFENKKREEQGKDDPDVELVAKWDNLSRDCCEMRSILKRELNDCVGEFVRTLRYSVKSEARTFRPPKVVEGDNTVADEIDKIFGQTVRDLAGLKDALEGIRLSHTYNIVKKREDMG